MKHNEASRAYFKAFYRGNRLRFWAAMVLMALSTAFSLIFSKVLGDILDIINAGDLRALAGTVSYTHLDVYKRQGPGCPAWRPHPCPP